MEIVLALAQYPIVQHQSYDTWKLHIRKWVQHAIEGKAKIIVFPEYGSMDLTALFEDRIKADLKHQLDEIQDLLPGFIDFFQSLAKEFECIIVAPSFPVKIESSFVNRAFVFSESSFSFQDKHFMTRFEDEEWGVASSDGVLRVFKTRFGNFGIQICFDIEFPIGGQLLAEAGADLIVVPSCTETLKGATRVHIGARARAMEQQIYVGVSQTIGNSEWSPAVDINYGYTAVYSSPDGDFSDEGIEAIEEEQTEGWLITKLDTERNKEIRENGQVFNYRWSQTTEMRGQQTVEIVEL